MPSQDTPQAAPAAACPTYTSQQIETMLAGLQETKRVIEHRMRCMDQDSDILKDKLVETMTEDFADHEPAEDEHEDEDDDDDDSSPHKAWQKRREDRVMRRYHLQNALSALQMQFGVFTVQLDRVDLDIVLCKEALARARYRESLHREKVLRGTLQLEGPRKLYLPRI